jgi:hypothetical protein
MEAFTCDHLVSTLIMCTCVGEKKIEDVPPSGDPEYIREIRGYGLAIEP